MNIYCGYNILMSGRFFFRILFSAVCPTNPSILHFWHNFVDFPLLRSHQGNSCAYRLTIGSEYQDTVISTYSSRSDHHRFLHLHDIRYSSSRLHFQPGFNHYPLLRFYKIVYNECRAVNSSESSCCSLCIEGVLHCAISRGGCYTK